MAQNDCEWWRPIPTAGRKLCVCTFGGKAQQAFPTLKLFWSLPSFGTGLKARNDNKQVQKKRVECVHTIVVRFRSHMHVRQFSLAYCPFVRLFSVELSLVGFISFLTEGVKKSVEIIK